MIIHSEETNPSPHLLARFIALGLCVALAGCSHIGAAESPVAVSGELGPGSMSTPAADANQSSSDTFTVLSPANGDTLSGIVTFEGQAGSQWVNVAAYDTNNGYAKVGTDVTPVNGSYSVAVDTTLLADGPVSLAIIAFSVPAGEGGGTSSAITIDATVQNATPPAPASCTDGIENGDETDVDCGGSCSTKCAVGQACGTGIDCSSASCVAGSCQTGEVPTFSDNFDSYDSNLWYRNSFDEGGDSFWTNDPSITPSVYVFADGKLNLGLVPTPDGSGIGKPFVSGIMDTYNAPNHFAQQYGYREVVVAVDKVVGMVYECVTLSPINFPPAFSTRVWTDANGTQQLLMFAYADGIIYSTGNDSGFDASVSHAYGLDWTASNIDFYIDRVLVASFANPGGAFTNGDPAYTKMHVNADFAGAPAVTDPGALPAYAHVDSFYVWAQKPF